MCTVTVRRDRDGWIVTMNRDELRDRAPEIPPAVESDGEDAPRRIWPRDGEAGGTWFGAREDGYAACLLNGYRPADESLRGKSGVPSRGEIIPRLLSEPGDGPLVAVESRLDPGPYPSFTLLVVGPAASRVVSWRRGEGIDRHELPAEPWAFLTSSSWREPEVMAWRRDLWSRWLDDGAPMAAGVPSIHLVEVEGREAWSPWMTRERSATRSVSQARWSAAAARLELRWWRRAEGEGETIDPGKPDAVLVAGR